MIVYSSMTLRQAVDEIMNRVTQFRTATNLDYQTVVLFVNRARREVLVKTLPFADWKYVETVDVAYKGKQGQAGGVPLNYIRHVRVLLKPTGDPGQLREARYVHPKEFFGLSDWRNKQSWNAATLENPIWTLWGDVKDSPPNDGLQFLCAPNTDFQTGVAPAGFSYYTGNELAGKMDCYTGPTDLANDADTLNIPYEFENALILASTLRCYAKLGQTNRLFETQQKVNSEQARLRELFNVKRETEKINLESFVDQQEPGTVTNAGVRQ